MPGGLERFVGPLHVKEASAHVQEYGWRFRSNLQRFLILVQSILVTLSSVLDRSNVVEDFEEKRILLQSIAIISFSFTELLTLVINKAETIQYRSIVAIDGGRFLVFDDRVVIHFSRKKRIAPPFMQAGFFKVFCRHQDLHLQEIAFSFFDEQRIVLRQAVCCIASILGIFTRISCGA